MDQMAAHPDLTLRGALLGVEHPEEGGLAGPGVPGQEDELPLRDVKRDVLESERAIREGLDDVREANHGPKDSRERGPAEREPGLRLAFLSEGLLEVRDEVPGVLDAAAQAHVPVGDSHGGARL